MINHNMLIKSIPFFIPIASRLPNPRISDSRKSDNIINMKMKDATMAYGDQKASTIRRFIGRVIRWGVFLFFLGAICSGIFLLGLYKYFSEDLPQISSLADYRPPVVSTVYADDNQVIAEFFKERRIVTPFPKNP